ncbi:AsmA family protein [Vibrio sinaloensis]|uniref:AsmA family protein n=1 Tax=Photobacterium sp. (strain ATCC 43367) TaxID=379097 RepID=UPI00205E6EBC|nr:AsmA family protein [Vibrio sinaloensis]UPQ88042.1 AsmA family protein [Vibrio sinaloensis]
MKKALWWLVMITFSGLVLSLLTLYALLQSRYAAQTVTTLFNQLTPYTLSTTEAHYQPPLQLTLANVELSDTNRTLQLPKLTLWLSQQPWQQGKLTFDSILIEGANLQLDQLQHPIFNQIQLQQLALKNVDLSAPKWSARDVSVQLNQPQWQHSEQTIPYADIQFAAKQLYMQGEALDDLLVDMRYRANNSTIFGSSFTWRDANFSGQAEQYQYGWSLVNVTIDKLTLPAETPLERLLTTLGNLQLPISHINSLDILGGSFNFQGWRFENLDASLENLILNQTLWQQELGYASFDAESITDGRLLLISPRAKLGMTGGNLLIDEFDTDFKQGRIQLQGEVSPQGVHLDKLDINGVKWLEQTEQLLADTRQLMAPLQSLSIDQLEVTNSQLIQVEHKPYWQVSGLNIEGSNLSLIKQAQWGLWQGSVSLSAHSANLDSLLTTQAKVSLSADNDRLTLSRAFVPLEQGYIEARGWWDRATVSAPWQIELHADGLPLQHFWLEQRVPFELTGLAEMDMTLSGLSGDYAMLAHSLSGQANISIRQASINASAADGEQQFEQDFALDEVVAHADRGRIRVQGQSDPVQLAGEWDLTKPAFASLLLQSRQQCAELWSDILSHTNVIKSVCAPAKSPANSN